MKCLTIITFISGSGGHGYARQLSEHNCQYRWYDHPRNNKLNPNRFLELNFAENHFRKRFSTNETFPHLFDRIEPFLTDINQYYFLIQEEITLISREKKLVYTCHEDPKIIRNRFPDSEIIVLIPQKTQLKSILDRHFLTYMNFHVQQNLHKLSGRSSLLNNDYWNMVNWANKNKQCPSILNYKMNFYNKTYKEVYHQEEIMHQNLFDLLNLNRQYADKIINM
jgi:hypothetical protein